MVDGRIDEFIQAEKRIGIIRWCVRANTAKTLHIGELRRGEGAHHGRAPQHVSRARRKQERGCEELHHRPPRRKREFRHLDDVELLRGM